MIIKVVRHSDLTVRGLINFERLRKTGLGQGPTNSVLYVLRHIMRTNSKNFYKELDCVSHLSWTEFCPPTHVEVLTLSVSQHELIWR